MKSHIALTTMQFYSTQNTDSLKNKNIASCSSENSANCIHYWSYRHCQVKKPTMKVFFHSVCCVINVIVLIAQI